MPTYAPSLWLDPPPKPLPPLFHDIDCDVVVVGAGYTGLSAAIALAEAGTDVVVLEREYAGFGASGRNAGHLTPTIGKDLPSLLRAFGRDTAGSLVRLAEEAVEHTESTITDRSIDCDYVPNGNVIAGLHEGHTKALHTAAAAAKELGAAVRLLSPDELGARGLPRFVLCGVHEARGGVLDPGKYVRGLRDAALAAGVRLFEQTAVDALDDQPSGVRATCGHWVVTAPHAVLATNAYTQELGMKAGRLVPISVSQFATVPLTAEQRARIGWPNGEGIYTAHESLENYRLTADGRIIGGSRYIRYRYGSRIPSDDDPMTFAKIDGHFRIRFPELTDVETAGHWSGPIAMRLNFLPFIGRVGQHSRIVASLAYAGHGVPMASYLGGVAARMVLGTGEAPPVLTERRTIPLPPEPLRWTTIRAITGALGVLDRRTDRRAQRRPG